MVCKSSYFIGGEGVALRHVTGHIAPVDSPQHPNIKPTLNIKMFVSGDIYKVSRYGSFAIFL